MNILSNNFSRSIQICTSLTFSLFIQQSYANFQTASLPPDWYPESLATDQQGNFYVGSWHQGAVVKVDHRTGKNQILVKSGLGNLSNTQGVLVDEKRNLLWVCSGNMGYVTVLRHESALKAYNLKTGQFIKNYPLPSKGYCNDLTMDEQNHIYVTDSLNPRVLKLDNVESQLKTWLENSEFTQGKEGFSLKGISYDKQNGLYFGLVSAVDYVYHVKVNKNGQAEQLSKIQFPRLLKNADAIRYVSPNQLVIFESNAFGNDGAYGGQISVAQVNPSSKNLKQQASLKTLVTGLNDPSSGVIWNHRIYFIESKYSLLFKKGKPDDTSSVGKNVPFDLQSVKLD